MTATLTAAAKMQDAYEVTTYRTARDGASCAWVRNGNRVASITEQADGTAHVALFIDYGQDGRSWCDGADYKTAAGIVRKVSGFLK